MRPLRLIAEEARRVDGYRAERHVSLLTLVVTEVVEFATLNERLGAEEVAKTLGDFARVATAVIEGERDGLLVRCGGGQLLAVFAEPTSAVLATRALHEGSLSLRSAIHLGQVAIERVGLHLDVFGRHMQRASALASAAAPGEILVTEPVADNARAFLEGADGPSLLFARRGQVTPEGSEHAIEAFALAQPRSAEPEGRPLPPAFIELDTGAGRRTMFDAGRDRRVVIGRSSTCDIPVATSASSRRHAMLLFEGAHWLLCDLGSTNGTRHNDGPAGERQTLSVGDRIGIGEVELVVTRLATARPAGGPRLQIDLQRGTASFADAPLPLSAAELVWFAYLARARKADDDGWVVAGQDGHAAFRSFAQPLWERPWSIAVRTRPLLDLVAGEPVDDDDLRNLRGKTVQKLKRFATEHPGAAAVVPASDGRHCQRLPIAAASIEILE